MKGGHKTSQSMPGPINRETSAGTEGQTMPDPTSTTPDTITADELRLLDTLGDLKTLQAVIDMDLVHADPRTRQQVARFLQITAGGVRFVKAAKAVKLRWPTLRGYCRWHPEIRALYDLGMKIGEEVRHCLREDEVDRRGVEGVRKPVRYKGVIVGHVTEYSDKCLELALKGGDTAGKYADRSKTESTVEGIVYHMHGIQRAPAEKVERQVILDQ